LRNAGYQPLQARTRAAELIPDPKALGLLEEAVPHPYYEALIEETARLLRERASQ
jgi:phage terminase small subunit